MKLLTNLSFAIIIAVFLAFAVPNSAFASNGNNFSNFTNFFHFNSNHGNDNNNNDNNNNDNKDKDKEDCKKHPEKRECHADVPEFGFVTGAIALLSSGGTFLFLKKRFN